MISRLLNKLLKNDFKMRSKGTLVLPDDAEVIYGEPGIVYETAENAILYKPLIQGSNFLDADKIDPTMLETVVANINNPTMYPVTTRSRLQPIKLEPAQKIIVREFEYPDPENPGRKIKHPSLMQAFTTKVRTKGSWRPDIGNEVDLDEYGYISKSAVKALEKYRPMNNYLFPHTPKMRDVSQAVMADCFLLSSIMSILAKDARDGTTEGADFIMNMMKQQEDGSVIVRLYDPVKLEPVYIRVENTEHVIKLGKIETGATLHNAPWVHILEKAYAGLALSELNEDEKKNQHQYLTVTMTDNVTIGKTAPSFLTVYSKGGFSDFATTVLTGKKCNSVEINMNEEIHQSIVNNYPFLLDKVSAGEKVMFDPEEELKLTPLAGICYTTISDYKGPNNPDISSVITDAKSRYLKFFAENGIELGTTAELKILFQNDETEWNSFLKSPLYSIFKDNPERLLEWIIYYNVTNSYANETFAEFKNICGLPFSDAGYCQSSEKYLLEKLDNLKKLDPPMPKELLKYFQTYITNPAENSVEGRIIYPVTGKSRSGNYAEREYIIFDKLKSELDKGAIISTGVVGSAAGLLTRHAYTVQDAYTKNIGGKERLFVRLVNPYMILGRDSIALPGTDQRMALPTLSRNFELDISEFIKYFDKFSIGGFDPVKNELKNIEAFSQVRSEDRSKYVESMLASDKSQFKQMLKAQSYADLHQLMQHLREDIQAKNQSLDQHPKLKGFIMKEMKQEKRLLRIATSQFNKKMAKDPGFPMMKISAQNYQDIVEGKKVTKKTSLRIFGDGINTFKKGLDMLLTKGMYTDYYLKVYEQVEKYKKLTALTSKNFRNESPEFKNDFINALKDENPNVREYLLSSQSKPDLAAITAFESNTKEGALILLDKQKTTSDDTTVNETIDDVKRIPQRTRQAG